MAPSQQTMPAHVAVIMDGNGRWARQRNLPRVEGHIAGIDSVREIVTTSRELGIAFLTLYAFSKENWSRPTGEVRALLELLDIYLERELPTMLENQVQFRAIGALDDLPKRLQRKLAAVTEETAKDVKMTLSLALSYSGREEILCAVRGLVKEASLGKTVRVSEKGFSRRLYTADMPDPDLLIRTSGELRLSNFLLWQLAYTEIYVTETLWPDFRRDAYMKALEAFRGRQRRFGRIEET